MKELELESSLENTSMKVAQLQEQVADGELVMRNMDAEKVNIEHRLTSVESELIVLRNQYRQSSE